MDAKFLSQPLASSESVDTFLDSLVDPDFGELTMVVAWAKRSGLARIADRLANFRARGGHVELIVGVSEGGATVEGLELSMALADKAYVFHHPGRTFHPKVYLLEGGPRRELLVGSSNMTAGGLGWNHEASIWLSESAAAPSKPFADARAWITELKLQSMSCLPLNQALLDQLMASADLNIGSESRARRTSNVPGAPEDSDGPATGNVSGLFSPPAMTMRQMPALPAPSLGTAASASPSPAVPPLGAGRTAPAPAPRAPVTRRWFRQLDNTAAQVVRSPSSNPTGNLRLTQAGHGIRHESYFYRDLFGGLPWSPRLDRPTEQEVEVDFDCVVAGTDYGSLTIRLSHDLTRGAGQSNIPTLLHWGPVLAQVLRRSSYVGQYVTIEKRSDGSFGLTIDATPTGVFLP